MKTTLNYNMNNRTTDYSDIFLTKYPEMALSWEHLKGDINNEFYAYIKGAIGGAFNLYEDLAKFQLSIVVDTNFVFGQLKAIIEKNRDFETSFIYKILQCDFLKVYAPYLLKKELFDKISTVLKRGKMKAREYAKKVLNAIEIKDAQWVEDWIRANKLISDKDDVAFLALAFDTSCHAILSNDKGFKQQNEAKIWKINEVDNIITNYNGGLLAIQFNMSFPQILRLFWKVLGYLFNAIVDAVKKIIQSLMTLSKSLILILSKIPSTIYLTALIISLVAIIANENAQNWIGKRIADLGVFIRSAAGKVREFIVWLMDLFKRFLDIFKDWGIKVVEFFAFFTSEIKKLSISVAELEAGRAQ